MLIPFDCLFKKYNIKTPGVLHLGANRGQEAEAYYQQGVRKVIWVEALPKVHVDLVRNIQKYPGSIALNACLSDVDGEWVAFNVANNEEQSSSMLEFGTHRKEHPTVRFTERVQLRTIRLDSLLKEHRIAIDENGWFLNADLQGAELLALKGMGDLLLKFNYAYIEVNEKELYKGCPLVGDIDKYLSGFGLIPFDTKMTRAGWGDRFYMRQWLT